jgi:hypothetical protein
MTNAGFVPLESGLEHDLLRRIDRDPSVVRLVSQPFELSWRRPKSSSHTPDLLAAHRDGAVTVWDVRPLEEQDDDFRAKSGIARAACARVGWRYQLFNGLGETERLNLLWLHGFRCRPVWADRVEEAIQTAARQPNATLGDLFVCDDGTGECKSVVWHLIWCGRLAIDLTIPWDLPTPVTIGSEVTE